ncbi:hypothetical protein Ddye_017718 [Dipteronia dyeriana]|uniref:Mechanosensitive ion channel MscS domain-containing protein n=1 Tax=Dipteronia dyeriana TaxID=168575 RepID=A0AAD9U9R8_9ROSI|nr:hypothetical protein Ddye_017718 [Dipteronia dyeriana]
MAGRRFSILKSRLFQSCNSYLKLGRYADQTHVKLSYALVNSNNYQKSEVQSAVNFSNTHLIDLGSVASSVKSQSYKFKPLSTFAPTSTNFGSRSSAISFVSISPFCSYRSYSSSSGSKVEKPENFDVTTASSRNEVDVGDSGAVGSDWADRLKDGWQSAVDAITYTGQKAQEASDILTPYIQHSLDTHPYLRNVVVPISCYLTCTILAWVVMPRILKRFHKYSMQGPASVLPGSLSMMQVPYEKSFWGALEDPVRYLITLLAFVQIGTMVAPTTIASQYLSQAWRGAIILSFLWFLHRWKTNVFSRALTSQSFVGLDKEKMLTLDKVSSVGLFAVGAMALAEACGVAVHSILTVGGIGGVATAFAAKDILGNVLSGLSVQFTKPFSLGDTIKAGSIEGQVVEIGLTTTSLLNAEKFPVSVPNSMFSSQVIVNKSRAQWRSMATKIPIEINDCDSIPKISEDIKSFLRSNSKVFLGKEAPYCYLSRIESSFAELTLGCNLKNMGKDELYSTQQDILLQSVRIIKEHGGSLGSTYGEGSDSFSSCPKRSV